MWDSFQVFSFGIWSGRMAAREGHIILEKGTHRPRLSLQLFRSSIASAKPSSKRPSNIGALIIT